MSGITLAQVLEVIAAIRETEHNATPEFRIGDGSVETLDIVAAAMELAFGDVPPPAPEPAEVDQAPSISDEMLAAADAIETLHLRHDGGAKMRRKVAAQLREWAVLAAHDAEAQS